MKETRQKYYIRHGLKLMLITAYGPYSPLIAYPGSEPFYSILNVA